MTENKEKSCRNCIHEVWAIGIGQGVFCLAIENQGKDFGHGMRTNHPLLPATTTYVCSHWIDEKNA